MNGGVRLPKFSSAVRYLPFKRRLVCCVLVDVVFVAVGSLVSLCLISPQKLCVFRHPRSNALSIGLGQPLHVVRQLRTLLVRSPCYHMQSSRRPLQYVQFVVLSFSTTFVPRLLWVRSHCPTEPAGL